MRIAVITLTRGGRKMGDKIKAALNEHEVDVYVKRDFLSEGEKEINFPLRDFVGRLVEKYDALVFVTAVGVAVRTLAGHLKGKFVDPRVVVVDEAGRHAISLLSGHRGANKLAQTIAGRIGGEAVITTSTDTQGKTCVEYFAQHYGLEYEEGSDLKDLNAAIANDEKVEVYSEIELKSPLPLGFELKPWEELDRSRKPRIVITSRLLALKGPIVVMRPKNLIVGLGARRGVKEEKILRAIREVFNTQRLSMRSIKALATIEARAKEQGFIKAASSFGVPLVGVSIEDIKQVEGDFPSSKFVKKKIGVGAVCEPCAVLAGKNAKLITRKTKFNGVTVAVAQETGGKSMGGVKGRGKVFVVGLGPGGREHLTPRAGKVLKGVDVVIGYAGYLRYVKDYLEGKEVISKGMGGEVDRAKIALELAEQGKDVAVVSSGDPGIYAMASVVLECASKAGLKPRIEVVPGVTAASAAAARLGAPIGHDFAVISLSDLLTPWKVIERRLEAAARGDFCIVLYNPRSRGRKEHLRRAFDVIRKHVRPGTPVGIVKNAMREGEKVIVTTVEDLPEEEVDMRTIVIIGNSESFTHHSWIITPRGYRGI